MVFAARISIKTDEDENEEEEEEKETHTCFKREINKVCDP